jgi:hypothetical protein
MPEEQSAVYRGATREAAEATYHAAARELVQQGYVPASEDWSTAIGQQVVTVRFVHAPDQAPAVLEALAGAKTANLPAQASPVGHAVKPAPATSHELMIIAGGILLAIFLVPFGGPQAPLAILVIALLVVFDIARGRRKAGK